MSYVKYEKKYVATYKELALTFIAFCVILFVLYPKDLLKDQILSESSNYDLSMLYLKNMLENDPENESLMIGLAEQSLRSGNRDLSLRLLELLHDSKDREIRKKAYVLSYRLAKENYFFLQDKEQKQEQMVKIRLLYRSIMLGLFYDENDPSTWYTESVFVSNEIWAYHFINKKLKKEPKNIQTLEEAYYLATKLDKKSDAIGFLRKLQKEDKTRKEKWIFAEYYMAMNYNEYSQAEELLKKHSRGSIKFKKELALFYSARGSYVKASSTYMSLYNKTNNYKQKRDYLLKALAALQAGSHFKKAVRLAYKYENRYINDKQVRTYMLKLYMASGDLNRAGKLAAKLLEKR